MATLNLIPVLDALGGTAATPAVFKAEARRAGRRATRVNGAEVTFATELIAVWDGVAWNTPPTLYSLPVDCYWNVKVQASGNRLEVNGILPSTAAQVDFADLIKVTPETGTVDTSTVAQYQGVQQYVSNQAARIDTVAATVFGLVATVQAQIEAAEATLAQITLSVQAAAQSAAQSAAAAATSAAAAAQATTVVATLTVVDTGNTLNTSSPAVTDLGDGLLYSTAATDNGDGTITSA